MHMWIFVVQMSQPVSEITDFSLVMNERFFKSFSLLKLQFFLKIKLSSRLKQIEKEKWL